MILVYIKDCTTEKYNNVIKKIKKIYPGSYIGYEECIYKVHYNDPGVIIKLDSNREIQFGWNKYIEPRKKQRKFIYENLKEAKSSYYYEDLFDNLKFDIE